MVHLPAILSKLRAHILQVRIAHVVHRKDEQMLVVLDTFADIGEQPSGLFLVGLFGGSGLMDHSRTLGTGHCQRLLVLFLGGYKVSFVYFFQVVDIRLFFLINRRNINAGRILSDGSNPKGEMSCLASSRRSSYSVESRLPCCARSPTPCHGLRIEGRSIEIAKVYLID